MAVIVVTSKIRNLDKLAREDPTVLASIDFAVRRAGEPIQELADADVSRVPSGATIFLTGHGSEGSVTGWDGKQIAAKLGATLPAKWRGTLFFLSCYAGQDRYAPGGDKDNRLREPESSVIAWLSAALAGHCPEVAIVGGTGPTVKANVLGDVMYVIREPSRTNAVKEALERTEHRLADLTRAYADWLEEAESATIAEKARQMAVTLERRMPAFVSGLQAANALYDATNADQRAAMVRVYRNGSEVSDGPARDRIVADALTGRPIAPPPPVTRSGGSLTFEQMRQASAEMRRRHGEQAERLNREADELAGRLAVLLTEDC